MDSILILAILLGIGYYFGSRTEKAHFRDLQRREHAIQNLGISVLGAKVSLPDAHQAQLFTGSVVISSDFFKTFIAGWLNFFGGRITVYESLLERGRREAMLRMQEAALAWGAEKVVNVRIESTELSGNTGQGIVSVEIMVYGTGVR